MRIQSSLQKILLALILTFTSSVVTAATAKDTRKLFEKYEDVMDRQKIELIDEVFTQKFLKAHGGKDEFIAKVKTLPFVKKKKGLGMIFQKLKTGKIGKFFSIKARQKGQASSEFILVEEDGKLKIDGTVADG